MLSLILAAALVAAPHSCSWNHPGMDRFTGNQVASLNDYAMDPTVRKKLQQRMSAHQYDEVVDITRDDITGPQHHYTHLHDMHYGYNHLCTGEVNRQEWAPFVSQSALVYCEGDVCVAVPAICGNVALLDRKPDDEIDISPAAGPALGAQAPALDSAPSEDYTPVAVATEGPTSFIPEGGSDYYWTPEGGGGYLFGGGGAGGGGNKPPVVVPPIITPPVVPPVVPPVIPPISPVPEPNSFYLILAGLVYVIGRRPKR